MMNWKESSIGRVEEMVDDEERRLLWKKLVAIARGHGRNQIRESNTNSKPVGVLALFSPNISPNRIFGFKKGSWNFKKLISRLRIITVVTRPFPWFSGQIL